MPKNKKPSGFQPIEYTPGVQNRPAVSEVGTSTPAPKPVKAQSAPTKPQTAADLKKEN